MYCNLKLIKKKSKLTQQAAAADCKYFVNHSEVKDMPCKQKDEF